MNKKELLLEGLCCGNCAAKIERGVSELSGVRSASINMLTQTLEMELADGASFGSILEQTTEIARRIEPDVVVKHKDVRGAKTVLHLSGLDCANCANKVQAAVAAIDGVASAAVDFAAQTMTIEAAEVAKLPALVRRAKEVAKKLEPDIEFIEDNEAQQEKKTGAEKNEILKWVAFGIGAAVFLFAAIAVLPQWLELALFLFSYLLIGGEVLWRALRNILRGQVFDENFLMSVATVGAFAVGEYPEGVAVMLFYQIGEFFQELAVKRSRKSITALMDIRPDYANLLINGEPRRVSPEEVGVGDSILVQPGEKVPLDGKVLTGASALDVSALTGESLPRDVAAGDDVLSGSINKNGVLTIEVSKPFGESTVVKILELVQNASGKKAQAENFITKFARYYTPAVVFSALALAVIPPLFISSATFAEWIHRALVFLVVSCPCALVVSIPLSFFGGIGGASRNGILVKGSNYLEALNNVETVVFDKTGTLTKGNFKVTRIVSGTLGEAALLETVALAESYSTHPIAQSIRTAYGAEIDRGRVTDVEEVPGHGIRASVDGRLVLAGNEKLMQAEGIAFTPAQETGTVVHLAVEGVYAGYLVIADEIKPDSKAAVQALRGMGVKRLVMLTGDSKATGEAVAREIGLDEARTELLPDQKVEALEALERGKSARGTIVFVGDGINDAPVLARADVGVAMGGVGSDAAIEAADVVLMTDEPSRLATAIGIARRTRRIVMQNIVFALAVKAAILILGVFGIATMWEAVFGDVGVALIAILNAMRVMRYRA